MAIQKTIYILLSLFFNFSCFAVVTINTVGYSTQDHNDAKICIWIPTNPNIKNFSLNNITLNTDTIPNAFSLGDPMHTGQNDIYIASGSYILRIYSNYDGLFSQEIVSSSYDPCSLFVSDYDADRIDEILISEANEIITLDWDGCSWHSLVTDNSYSHQLKSMSSTEITCDKIEVLGLDKYQHFRVIDSNIGGNWDVLHDNNPLDINERNVFQAVGGIDIDEDCFMDMISIEEDPCSDPSWKTRICRRDIDSMDKIITNAQDGITITKGDIYGSNNLQIIAGFRWSALPNYSVIFAYDYNETTYLWNERRPQDYSLSNIGEIVDIATYDFDKDGEDEIYALTNYSNDAKIWKYDYNSITASFDKYCIHTEHNFAFKALKIGDIGATGFISANLIQAPFFTDITNCWKTEEYSDSSELNINYVDIGSGKYAAEITDLSNKDKLELWSLWSGSKYKSIHHDVNTYYKLSFKVKSIDDYDNADTYVGLKFTNSNNATDTATYYLKIGYDLPTDFKEYSIKGLATTTKNRVSVYFSTSPSSKGKIQITDINLISDVKGYPESLAPQYTRLSDLHLNTFLVFQNYPNCAIVRGVNDYSQDAPIIQSAIYNKTGITIPIIYDTSNDADIPFKKNLILLGNRFTNKAMENLYNKYFIITDLTYPGIGGYELRSLHNPFGNGYNAIIVGGSDVNGVKDASEELVELINLQTYDSDYGYLYLGYTNKIKLGANMQIPDDFNDVSIWETSPNNDMWNFGWNNTISKRMAFYYMTGDSNQIEHIIKYAIPLDNNTIDEMLLLEGTDERFPEPNKPIQSAYHYAAPMMILFWDIIEESPDFNDNDRLTIVNAFAKQFDTRKNSIGKIYNINYPPLYPDRHYTYEGLSLYVLARYFNTHYPSSLWSKALNDCKYFFDSMLDPNWTAFYSGESASFFGSSYGPIISYMLMTDKHDVASLTALESYLNNYNIMSDFDGFASNVYGYTGLNDMQKLMYMFGYATKGGQWYFHRNRFYPFTSTDLLKVGQAYSIPNGASWTVPNWTNKWTSEYMPNKLWRKRGCIYPENNSFYRTSFRDTNDTLGDYLYISGCNSGVGTYSPYSLSIEKLKLNSHFLLKPSSNVFATEELYFKNGVIPLDANMIYSNVIGSTAFVIAETDGGSNSTYKRAIAIRKSNYAIVGDDFTFDYNAPNMRVVSNWQMADGTLIDDYIRIQSNNWKALPQYWQRYNILQNKYWYGCNNYGDPNIVPILVRQCELGAVRVYNNYNAENYLAFEINSPGTYNNCKMWAEFYNYGSRYPIDIYFDEELVADDVPQQGYNKRQNILIYKNILTQGKHTINIFEDSDSIHSGGSLAVCGLIVQNYEANDLPLEPNFYLLPSETMEIKKQGTAFKMFWRSDVKTDQKKTLFYLLGQEPNNNFSLNCAYHSSQRAAGFVDDFNGFVAMYRPADINLMVENTRGDFVIVEDSHLFGYQIERAGPNVTIFKSLPSSNIDWDFNTGTMYIITSTSTTLRMCLEDPNNILLDGIPFIPIDEGSKMYRFDNISSGSHVLSGVKPALWRLDMMRSRIKTIATRQKDFYHPPSSPTNVNWPQFGINEVYGQTASAMTIAHINGNDIICIASDSNIFTYDVNGDLLDNINDTSKVTSLWWSDENNLLLTGTHENIVTAYDLNFDLSWTFQSEDNPTFLATGKTYWGKSKYPGIYSLYSGHFDGYNRIFVGSASTIEILNPINGSLIKSYPAYWGPVHEIALAAGKLLVAKYPNAYNDPISLINSIDMNQPLLRYDSYPSGQTSVQPYGQHRIKMLYNNNDANSLYSATNGNWSRLTVYSTIDPNKALYNLQFGNLTPINDFDVADINCNNSSMEVIIASSEGYIACYDSKLTPKWISDRLPSEPTTIRIIPVDSTNGAVIVVGTANGHVYALNKNGIFTKRDATGTKCIKIEPVIIDSEPGVAVLSSDTSKRLLRTYKIQ